MVLSFGVNEDRQYSFRVIGLDTYTRLIPSLLSLSTHPCSGPEATTLALTLQPVHISWVYFKTLSRHLH